jgi:hypothetical protein
MWLHQTNSSVSVTHQFPAKFQGYTQYAFNCIVAAGTLCRRFRFSSNFNSDVDAMAGWRYKTVVGCIVDISIL